MRVVITGATGNVGTAVVEAMTADPGVDTTIGVARRLPRVRSANGVSPSELQWRTADVATDDLDVLAGADVVIHLAWLIQPVRDERHLFDVNVHGTSRVVDAAVRHGVRRLVVASSVGTYAGRADETPVDESWPATGIESSVYSRQKADVESLLDAAESAHPELSIVRMRTALVFSARAASEIARYFLGPLVPWSLVGRGLLPVLPFPSSLGFQVVHTRDAADAYRRAALGDANGSFNIAAEPRLGADELAAALSARHVDLPVPWLRGAVAASYAFRLQRTSPGWIDLASRVPVMDSGRARTDLGWTPTIDARRALSELITGWAERTGSDTPPLRPGRRGRCLPFPDTRTISGDVGTAVADRPDTPHPPDTFDTTRSNPS